jgi:hypothetical protein
MDAYYAGFDTPVSTALAWAGWGWHGETGLHALRIILGGLFDRYPELQFIIGHMGENIPYFLDRADYFLSGTAKHLKRRVAEYFHDNFYITTSGLFSVAPLLCALSVVGAERPHQPGRSREDSPRQLGAAPADSPIVNSYVSLA